MSDSAAAAPARHTAVDAQTVEDVVRKELAKALGGRRGMAESAVPTLGFTITYLTTRELKLALAIGGSLAVLLLVIRIAQKTSVQFVINSFVGIAIAGAFALRSGKAEDVFLPGIIYNAAYGALMTFSVLIRWPIVGLLIGSVTGDLTGWRLDRGIVRLCSKLTWLLIAPCAIRVAVQYPLYLGGEVAALGVSKIVLGWPLQVAALSAMVYVLARGHTPLQDPPEQRP